jgi:hypothetical protein
MSITQATVPQAMTIYLINSATYTATNNLTTSASATFSCMAARLAATARLLRLMDRFMVLARWPCMWPTVCVSAAQSNSTLRSSGPGCGGSGANSSLL